MSYHLEKPQTVRGITVQVVCSIVDTTVIKEKSLFVSRQKTPIVILVFGYKAPKVFDLSGNTTGGKTTEDILRQIPEVRDLLK